MAKATTSSRDIPSSKGIPHSKDILNRATTASKTRCTTRRSRDIPLSRATTPVTRTAVAPVPAAFAPVSWPHLHAAAAWISSSKRATPLDGTHLNQAILPAPRCYDAARPLNTRQTTEFLIGVVAHSEDPELAVWPSFVDRRFRDLGLFLTFFA